jgi:hypothetical protein
MNRFEKMSKTKRANNPLPSWVAVHHRLAHERGSARGLPCLDCGQPAMGWTLSWRRARRDQLVLETRPGPHQGSPYSTDSSLYDPRCTLHARRYGIIRIAELLWGETPV